MQRVSLALLLLGLAVGSAHGAAASSAATTLHQGILHDALYGLCVNGQQGIAVGAAGVVLRSKDAGQSWQAQSALGDAALLDVNCGPGPQLLVGQEGLIYRQKEDGFEKLDSGSEQRLLAVASNSQGLAFAVGGFGTVLRSSDGGDSWSALTIDWEAILKDFVEPHIYTVDVSEAGVVTMAGEFGLVLHSVDQGDNWTVANHAEASIFSLRMQGQKGLAVGQDGSVLTTEDGGESWQAVAVPSTANLLDVWGSAEGEIIITGIRVVLYSKDHGKHWVTLDDSDFKIGWYQRIWPITNASNSGPSVLLAGHGGRVVKLDTAEISEE